MILCTPALGEADNVKVRQDLLTLKILPIFRELPSVYYHSTMESNPVLARRER